MAYKKYGEIFRTLRKQRKFPIYHFEKLGISKATLAKFERGESMMGFDRVVIALHELGTSLEEYEQFLNNFLTNDKESIIADIEHAEIIGDKEELINLSDKAKQLNFHLLALSAKSLYKSLNHEEAEQITEYLFSINIWGLTELNIFYFTLKNFSARELQIIINSFLIEKHPLFASEKYRNCFLKVAYRASILFSSRGYLDSAKYIIDCIDNYHLEHTLFNQNLRNLTLGYWNYCFKDTKKGYQQIQVALDIFSNLEKHEIANYYQHMLNLDIS